MTLLKDIKILLKNINVKANILVDKDYIDFEILPTWGFVKKPIGYNVETNGPTGFLYGTAIGWLVFGIAITYIKKGE